MLLRDYDLLHAECSDRDRSGSNDAHEENAVLAALHLRGRDGQKVGLIAVLMTLEGYISRLLCLLAA